MNKWIAVILAGALIAGGAVVLYLARPGETGVPQPPDEPVFAETGAVQPEATEESETTAVDPEPAESISPARRIRHGTAREQDLANAGFDLPPSGNEKTDRIIRQVEKGLAGDADALIQVSRLINDCSRGMGSEEQVQQRLDRMAQFNARNPDAPIMPGRGGGGGNVEYRSFDELEAEMWAQFDACQASKTALDESLYEQVSRLAESGLPSARYLYSVWPPNQDSLITTDTLEMLEYQSLALEYTWQNMQEREPLGLVAMAQSYSARRLPMFTPSNPIQGQVFLLASMKCGIENEWLTRRSQNFGQGFSRFQAQNTEMPSLDEDAAALAEMFCPIEAEDD